MKALVVVLLLKALLNQSHPAAEPWSLVVLIDVSASMRFADARTGLALVAERARAQVDSHELVRIGAFASELRLASTLDEVIKVRPDADLLARDQQWRYGPSRLWDAVTEVAAGMARNPGRRVILVVTDGKATGNRIGPAAALSLLQEHKTELWMVSVVRGFGDDHLRSLVAREGGRVFDVPPRASQQDRWQSVASAVASAIQTLKPKTLQ
jgi:hypothetical protein